MDYTATITANLKGVVEHILKGVVEHITYHNADNGWSVLKLMPFNNSQKQETVIVYQTKVFPGATMEFQGSWIIHPKYGRQFKATTAYEIKPATTAALEKYLSSGLIKGVGPKTAKKIVQYFGKSSDASTILEIFESEIERLTEVPGIANKKLEMISNAWKEHKSIRDVMIFLQSHGISTLFAVKIYKAYGEKAIQYVSEDPYCLSTDFYGIGFFSADKVALSIGFAPDSNERIMAAIRHVLSASKTFGHCYLTLSQIEQEVTALLGFDLKYKILDILDHMQKATLLMVRYLCPPDINFNHNESHKNNNAYGQEHNESQKNNNESHTEACYYSRSLYFDELYVAKKISTMCKKEHSLSVESQKLKPKQLKHEELEHKRLEQWTNLYCKANHINLSDEQKRAVISILSQRFSILTGGPGCGKTTTTLVIVNLLEAMDKSQLISKGAQVINKGAQVINKGAQVITKGAELTAQTEKHNDLIKILLAAPTGRAAQRMTEVIGREAKTIHRLLEWQGSNFKKNEKNRLKADFLIIDECSMLDINLTAALLKAVPESCKVLFIGDADQLPSVGPGNVLRDMINSGVVPCFVLTQIFRQAKESLIIKYAHQINKGEMPWIASPFKKPEMWKNHTDCMFIDSDEATKEQIHFITHVKKACNLKNSELENLQSAEHKPQAQQAIYDNQDNQDNQAQLYEFKISETIKPYQTEITIPKKFHHVDLNALYRADTEVRELITVLKSVHPWSSLHYGYSAANVVRQLYLEWIPKYYGDKCEIQILSPMHRGTLGTVNLNQMIQSSANPAAEDKREFKVGERIFRTGDRVIHRRNNYNLGVFNGDIGTIININTLELTCSVAFYPDKRVVNYNRDDILQLDLAYAITIHKSQGSEFDIVIIPVLSQHFKMLFRNLIYTGLTRAKKLAIFVGTRKAMSMAVKNQDTSLRQTALEDLLKSLYEDVNYPLTSQGA